MTAFTTSPRNKLLSFFLPCLGVSVILPLALLLIEPANKWLFSQLVTGLTGSAKGNGCFGQADYASAFSIASTLLFSTMATVWAGHTLNRAGRLMVSVQLIAAGTLYQFAVWRLCGAEGSPLTLAIGIVLGIMVGAHFKSKEEEKRALGAKQTELTLRSKQLEQSRLLLVQKDESDRRLLASDLHDQVLSDLRNILKSFNTFADDRDPGLADSIRLQLTQSMSSVREIMDDLCPILLEEFGLVAAIEDRLDKASSTGGLDVRLINLIDRQDLKTLSLVELQLLYRLVQESITNVCKHACAANLHVIIHRDEEFLLIDTVDDGAGIDREKLTGSSRGSLYMRMKAALIGATVLWAAGANGRGTKVTICLPLAAGIACSVEPLEMTEVQSR